MYTIDKGSEPAATNKTHYQIAVIPGDGIGPEVCKAAVDVITAALEDQSLLSLEYLEAGAECFRKSGDAFPAETLQACMQADAILHGAAGLPDVCYEDGTEAGQDFSLNLRKALDLYANIRPIKLYAGVESTLRKASDDNIDYVIVRENTEGLYASRGGGNRVRDDVCTDTMVITRLGIERIVHAAAQLCMQRTGAPRDGRHRVTIVDKANVLRSFAFFRDVADQVLAQYPEIEVEHVLVDAMTVHMLQRPDTFDVVVMENILGDILSDLGSATVGGMGMSPSAELSESCGYFQASHGSAPLIAGKNIANPVGTILASGYMLHWLGRRFADNKLLIAAEKIETAVTKALQNKSTHTVDLGGQATTRSCTQAIIDLL